MLRVQGTLGTLTHVRKDWTGPHVRRGTNGVTFILKSVECSWSPEKGKRGGEIPEGRERVAYPSE